MKGEEKYLNFPVPMLENFLTDHQTVLNNIARYGVYKYALTLALSENEIERFKNSSSYLGISFNNPNETCRLAKESYNLVSYNAPHVGISMVKWWEFYKEDKTEFEKAALLGYLSLKSIIQKKPFAKIDNRFFLARMDGKAAACDFDQLSDPIKKYANEYQTKKIKNALLDWNLTHYARYTRGFYVSFTLSLEDLIFYAETRRKSTKEKQQKAFQKEALDKAMNRIIFNTTK